MTAETVTVRWEYEDSLPEIDKRDIWGMFAMSQIIDGVRLYPYLQVTDPLNPNKVTKIYLKRD